MKKINKAKTTLAFLYYTAEQENNYEREFTSTELYNRLSGIFTTTQQASGVLRRLTGQNYLKRRVGHAQTRYKQCKNFYTLTNSGRKSGRYFYLYSTKYNVDLAFVLFS